MAVITRQRRSGVTYYVFFRWKGEPIWEHAGTNLRAAERLDRIRKREVETGTYQPTPGTSRKATVDEYMTGWIERRTNKSADTERHHTKHVRGKEWFASMLMDDVRPLHVGRLVKEFTDARVMAPKYIANIYGTLRTMFRDAHIEEIIGANPCALPKGALKRTRKKEREPYTREEVRALTSEAVDQDKRVFCALAFYLGAREGELCGLRWADYDREAEPFGAMSITRQYGGEGDDAETKTETPRKVPVHPELERVLAWWWREGFELVYLRRPTAADHIVPMRARKANRHGVKAHHTRSSAYKMFVAACKQAGVANRSLHSTRHTMISWARRGGARKDLLEMITHNAKGDIVDQYTSIDWEPLCEVISKLSYAPPARGRVADACADAETGSASEEADPRWRRWESNHGSGASLRGKSRTSAGAGRARSAPISAAKQGNGAGAEARQQSADVPPELTAVRAALDVARLSFDLAEEQLAALDLAEATDPEARS